jgi:hypothetical protein
MISVSEYLTTLGNTGKAEQIYVISTNLFYFNNDLDLGLQLNNKVTTSKRKNMRIIHSKIGIKVIRSKSTRENWKNLRIWTPFLKKYIKTQVLSLNLVFAFSN